MRRRCRLCTRRVRVDTICIVDCAVVVIGAKFAPSKVARRSGDRVKTDRRDALHLAEQLQEP